MELKAFSYVSEEFLGRLEDSDTQNFWIIHILFSRLFFLIRGQFFIHRPQALHLIRLKILYMLWIVTSNDAEHLLTIPFSPYREKNRCPDGSRASRYSVEDTDFSVTSGSCKGPSNCGGAHHLTSYSIFKDGHERSVCVFLSKNMQFEL